MEAMNLVLPQIEQAGARLVAISPQTVKQSFFMHDQHKLRFPLLSDAGNRVARQFGLTYRVPALQEAVYRRAFVNLPFTNGDESWELPIPATYIVDRDGTILYASANEDYTERPEPGDIIRMLQGNPSSLRGQMPKQPWKSGPFRAAFQARNFMGFSPRGPHHALRG